MKCFLKVDLLVSRHRALREYLREVGVGCDADPVLFGEVAGNRTYGLNVTGRLPLPLAADARTVLWAGMKPQPGDLGCELSLEELRELVTALVMYRADVVPPMSPPRSAAGLDAGLRGEG